MSEIPENSAVRFCVVDENSEGQRVDNFLLSRLKGVPKSRIYRLLRKGEVRVNKKRVKPESRLEIGDQVRIPPVRVSEKKRVQGPGIKLQKLLADAILFENDELMVVDKPAGLAVHGGSGIDLGLIEAMRVARSDLHYLELVHRLDRDTSGCVMLAKKRSALRFVQNQMREREIGKEYFALVLGKWPRNARRVDAPLYKFELSSGEKLVRVDAKGKPSVSHFRIDQRFREATLVRVGLETGRTHQIRVHSQYMGCPLAGDAKYGGDESEVFCRQHGLKRMFLHAHRLEFSLPSNPEVTTVVESPLPKELALVLENLNRV